VPIETIVTVELDTVQTAFVLELNVTGRPELAVALIANGGVPIATLFSGPNAMVCINGETSSESLVEYTAEADPEV
jgi:hypothetical protein